MVEVREIDWPELERLLAAVDVVVPIEQTKAWADYQETIKGRAFWKCLAASEDRVDVAYVSFIDYLTHGYHYLRTHHGPMWVEPPTERLEAEVVDALASYVRSVDRRQAFLRMAIDHELPSTRPTLSSIPYDTTVVIDLTGGDDAILSRMKPRGRRDVRKSLREAPVSCADETKRAMESFAEYYQVMVETAERDGFVPAPLSDYQNMITVLGSDHCRVFAGRLDDGVVATWSIVTLSNAHATRYYAASRSDTMRNNVTDKLIYFECCSLGREGCTDFDLMAIGSDFSPSLKGLNVFKTKFAKEVTHVAPDRDVPIRTVLYKSLQMGKRAISAAHRTENEE